MGGFLRGPRAGLEDQKSHRSDSTLDSQTPTRARVRVTTDVFPLASRLAWSTLTTARHTLSLPPSSGSSLRREERGVVGGQRQEIGHSSRDFVLRDVVNRVGGSLPVRAIRKGEHKGARRQKHAETAAVNGFDLSPRRRWCRGWLIRQRARALSCFRQKGAPLVNRYHVFSGVQAENSSRSPAGWTSSPPPSGCPWGSAGQPTGRWACSTCGKSLSA